MNNLPVRVGVERGTRLSDWLPALHEHTQEIAQHQYASLGDIQAWAGVPWRLRLFDSLVGFQNYLVGEDVLRWGDVELERLAAPEADELPLDARRDPGLGDRPAVAGASAVASPPRRSTMMLDGLATCARSTIADRPDA